MGRSLGITTLLAPIQYGCVLGLTRSRTNLYFINRNINHFQEVAMKLKELKDHLQNIPDDYEVKVSSFIIQEGETNVQYFAGDNEQFIPVNDESILGISSKNDFKQVHIIGVQQQMHHFGSGDFAKDSP